MSEKLASLEVKSAFLFILSLVCQRVDFEFILDFEFMFVSVWTLNYSGAKLWNSLPLDAKVAESVYQFKNIIRGNDS